MARPTKQGLDYFPLDCYFLDDIKIRKILKSNGAGAIGALVDLLGNIYRDEGYYMRWDDDICFLVADKVGTSEASVQEIVIKAVQVDLFDKKMFDEYQILTSKGIQKRFFEAVKRRQEVNIILEYILLENINDYSNIKKESLTQLNGVNVNNNSQNVYSNEQSKVKESKVKKSKVNNHDEQADDQGTTLQSVILFWQENIGMASSHEQENLIHWCEDLNPDLVLEAIKRAIEQGKPRYSYVNGILNNFVKKGIKTIADAKAEQVKYHNSQRSNPRYKYKREETQPAWMNKQSANEISNNTDPNVPTAEELQKRLKDIMGGAL